MSWAAVLALCASAYVLKLLGVVAASRAGDSGALNGRLDVIVVPVIAALIAVQTVGAEREIVFDARLPALIVAGLLVWRRAPLLVVVIAAGLSSALLHFSGL